MAGVNDLGADDVRQALGLLGIDDPPANRAAAVRRLRELLQAYGTVRTTLDRAPEGARAAFVRLAQDGPADVDALLGRGWWGHGTLPPPLDWLQVRALVGVSNEGVVHATEEARSGWLDLTLDLPVDTGGEDGALQVQAVGCVVVATVAAILDRALTVGPAALRAVAPTVAVSPRSDRAVTAALRAAGIPLADDLAVTAVREAPALPGTAEDAVGPRAIRGLLDRAVAEGRQVRLEYFASSRGGAATDRVVDPWTFRDDLLRGYCHLRAGERTFAVDRIGRLRLLPGQIEHRLV
ncbi:MAG: WYL domain-containing protein [Actinomycetota bacterium]|nr:WYL domain-containing protein [Actinomycetota bacterium]